MKKTIFSVALTAASVLLTSNSMASETQCLNANVSGQGQAVLLLPGFISDESVWTEVRNDLAKQYQVHQLSIAGFGKNKACHKAQTIVEAVKSELANYLTNNKLQNPILVGHSMGGLLAFDASLNPNINLKAAISVDGLPFIGPIFTRNNQTTADDLMPQATAMKTMYQQATPEQLVAFTKQGIMLQTNQPSRYNDIINMAKHSDATTAGSALHSVMTTDLRPKLAKLTNPVLLIGASGAFTTDAQHQAAKAMYQAQIQKAAQVELAMNSKGHHFLMWDQTDWLINTIKTYISQQSDV
ncbi:MAG: alpha/beta fold hydrolase [Psychrobium sp.]